MVLIPLSDYGLVRVDTLMCHGAMSCHLCRSSDVVIVDFLNGCLLSAVLLVVVSVRVCLFPLICSKSI